MLSLIRMVFLAALLAFAGCATASKSPKEDIVGYYAMTLGGFNEELNVELAYDGSYVLNHALMCCSINDDGELLVDHSQEKGTWKFEQGVLTLTPTTQTQGFPNQAVFVPIPARRLVPKPDGRNQLLMNAVYPDHFVLTKTAKPKPDIAQRP